MSKSEVSLWRVELARDSGEDFYDSEQPGQHFGLVHQCWSHCGGQVGRPLFVDPIDWHAFLPSEQAKELKSTNGRNCKNTTNI